MEEIRIKKIEEPHLSGNFEITNLNEVLKDQNMEEGLHRHDFYFLLILGSASGKHHIDFVDYPIVSNSVFLMRPGQVHELVLEKGSTGYLIVFDQSFYPHIHNYKKETLQKAVRHNFYLPNNSIEKLMNLADSIFKEHHEKQAQIDEVIQSYLHILFIELMRIAHESDPLNHRAKEHETLEQFMQLLESDISTSKQVSQYAEKLCISPYKLNSITKQLLAKTSSQLINEQILLEAKRLLLATSNQVNEIAFQLGYEDPGYFIRFFKKHTGHTPQAFRQHFR
jgi:AraC-like DNA-binding protein